MAPIEQPGSLRWRVIGIGAAALLVLAGCDRSTGPSGGPDDEAQHGRTSEFPPPGWFGSDDPTTIPMKFPRCGDGELDPRETCDDGNTADGDGCDGHCLKEGGRCGDGVRNASEQCDDGSQTGGDGCASCRMELSVCGDSQCPLLDDLPVEQPSSVEIPAGRYAIGNAALRAKYAHLDASLSADGGGAALTPQNVWLASFGIEKAPSTDAWLWREADAICASRGRRLPTEAEWEAAFRMNEGDGSDAPNPLGLEVSSMPAHREWTATGVIQSENPGIAGSKEWHFIILKNIGDTVAMRQPFPVDLDPIAGIPAIEGRFHFRCVE